MQYITPEDLAPFATIEAAKAAAMIADAEAMAASVAPCLADASAVLESAQLNVVRAILRRAVLRWNEVGTGAVTQQSAGPFQQSLDTTRSAPKSLFWPSEIADLQQVCKSTGEASSVKQVFTVSTRGSGARLHSPICDLNLGGSTCSCGSYLNRNQGPIPEYGEVYP